VIAALTSGVTELDLLSAISCYGLARVASERRTALACEVTTRLTTDSAIPTRITLTE